MKSLRPLNKHFTETLETLNTFEWPSNNTGLLNELTAIIKKFIIPFKNSNSESSNCHEIKEQI